MKRKQTLFFYVFIAGLEINLLQPILPLILADKAIANSQFGLMAAFFGAGAIMGSLFLLLVKKRINKSFLLSIFFLGLFPLGFIFLNHRYLLFLIRFLTGFAFAVSIIIANAYISALAREEQKLVKYVAISVGAFGLGNALGYLLSGYLGALSWHLSLYLGLILAVVTAILSLIPKDVSLKPSGERKVKPGVVGIILNAWWLTLFALIATLLPFYIKDLGGSTIAIGWYLFGLGVSGLLINMIVNPLVKKHLSPIIGLTLSALLLLSSLLLSFWSPLIFFFLFYGAVALARPIINAQMVINFQDDLKSFTFANISMYLGTLLGGPLAALLYEKGVTAVLLAGIVGVMIFLFLILIFKRLLQPAAPVS